MEPFEIQHSDDPEGFQPYERETDTLARLWVIPGTPGMEHRLGGLEKAPVTGTVSYAPEDHEAMCRQRADKVARIADTIPELEVTGQQQGDLLVLSWGGSYGAVFTAVQRAVRKGLSVGHAHLRHLNPFPRNLGDILGRFDRVLVPELNSGQLALLVKARYLRDIESLSKIQGQPFSVSEIEAAIEGLLVRND
jgi:2-oxoglutarate ferredoxin oxidoreductase subunit alpha